MTASGDLSRTDGMREAIARWLWETFREVPSGADSWDSLTEPRRESWRVCADTGVLALPQVAELRERAESSEAFGQRVVADMAEVEARAEAAEAKVERVEALAVALQRPLSGLRRRANTGEDFARLHEAETERCDIARSIRAALASSPTTHGSEGR